METARADLAAEGVGYLDMRDYNRARWAWEQSHPASPFMKWLKVAGYVSFDGTNSRVQSSNTGHVGIPATKLAWEEITRIADELYTKFGDVETAACDMFGQFLLEQLSREVSTAAHRWPAEEKPHKVNAVPCPSCRMLTLMYRPPRERNDEVLVECLAGCAETMTGEVFADLIDLVEQESMTGNRLEKRWVVVEDAAELTKKSQDTIWRWAREGLVRTLFYEGKKFYNVADLYKTEEETRARSA